MHTARIATLFVLTALHTLAMTACAPRQAPPANDGQIVALPGNNPWGHEVALDPIPLLSPGTHTFTLSRLPSDDMLVVLSIDEPTPEAIDAVDKADVRIRMVITNQTTGETSVKQGRLISDFQSTYEGWERQSQGQPWEFRGIWFRPRRHDVFTFRIDVSVSGSHTGFVSATPMVRGRPSGSGGR